jgi:LacI family transcriptional regulator
VHALPAAARPLPWGREQAALGRWIAELPKPVAVFVVNDSRGQRLLEACRRVGAAVPDEVAVLANENDELVCSMATPPLSSLIAATEKMGYEAARLLDRLMAGGPRPRKRRGVRPAGRGHAPVDRRAGARRSVVARAVRFIREHAGDGIRVPQVLAQVGRVAHQPGPPLRAALGRTPHDEIVRVQLQRAMELLAQTSLKTLAVAEKAGFRHVEYMGVVFRKKLG